jgi:hypothetical protein
MQDLMSPTHHGFFARPDMPTLLCQDHAHTTTFVQQSPEGPVVVTEIAPALAQTPVFMEQFEPTMELVTQLNPRRSCPCWTLASVTGPDMS